MSYSIHNFQHSVKSIFNKDNRQEENQIFLKDPQVIWILKFLDAKIVVNNTFKKIYDKMKSEKEMHRNRAKSQQQMKNSTNRLQQIRLKK